MALERSAKAGHDLRYLSTKATLEPDMRADLLAPAGPEFQRSMGANLICRLAAEVGNWNARMSR